MASLLRKRALCMILALPFLLSLGACAGDAPSAGGSAEIASRSSSDAKASESASSASAASSAVSAAPSSAQRDGSLSFVPTLPFSVGVNVDGMQDFSDNYDRLPAHLDSLTSADTYKDIRAQGFDHIRLAVNFWRAYLDDKDQYTTEEYMSIVDTAVRHALDAGLYVMLNFHGWFEIGDNPEDCDVCVSIWDKVAERYKDYDTRLIFEPINEPWYDNGRARPYLSDQKLNELQARLIQTIRGKGSENAERLIICCTADGNKAWKLGALELPMDDGHLAVAIHEYEPSSFTGQDFRWSGTGGQKITLSEAGGIARTYYDFSAIKQFMMTTGIPVVLNEFGMNLDSPSEEDVTAYLRGIAEQCRKLGIPYAYWQYLGGNYNRFTWRNRDNEFALYREIHAYGKKEWDKVALDAIFLR